MRIDAFSDALSDAPAGTPASVAAFLHGASLTVIESFAAAESRWRVAQTTARVYGFQNIDWLGTWQHALGNRQGWSPCLVALQDAGQRTLMLLPLGIRRQRGVRTLSFLGGEVTDYNTGLFDPAFAQALAGAGDTTTFVWLWRRVLDALPAVDLVRLRRMPEQLPAAGTADTSAAVTIRNPFIGLPGAGHTENAHAATLPATFAEFQQPRSAKVFADTRRQSRRLAALGELRIVIDENGPARAAAVDAMARQKSRRWQQTGSRDLFAEAGYLAFYQALAANGMDGGAIMVSALYVGDTIVATHWGMRYGNRLYWLMPGYEDGEWERYSAGRVLLDAVVQWAIAEKLHVFDLTVGDEAYKQQWADHRLPLYALVEARSAKGAVLLRMQALSETLRDWAKRRQWLRRMVVDLRARLRASRR